MRSNSILQSQEPNLLAGPTSIQNVGLVVISMEALSCLINQEVKKAILELKDEENNPHAKTAFEAYYTPSELARKWGVTTGTLCTYQNKGIITPIHKENRVYYDKNIIDNMENPRYSRKTS